MIVLETERLLFRDHAPADLDPFCALEADPEVRRVMEKLGFRLWHLETINRRSFYRFELRPDSPRRLPPRAA